MNLDYESGFAILKELIDGQPSLSVLQSFGPFKNIYADQAPRFIPSSFAHVTFRSAWPYYLLELTCQDRARGNPKYVPLTRLGLPLFPNEGEAIKVLL